LLQEIAGAAEAESTQYPHREVALRSCLQKLPEHQRALIVRRYQPGVAVNSLAEELGKSAKAVSESLRRIREALRLCIERTLAAESRP
jgi:RNA polymerase sigma-70 factor (ECF subfamily)